MREVALGLNWVFFFFAALTLLSHHSHGDASWVVCSFGVILFALHSPPTIWLVGAAFVANAYIAVRAGYAALAAIPEGFSVSLEFLLALIALCIINIAALVQLLRRAFSRPAG
jgi:hypothetical protein